MKFGIREIVFVIVLLAMPISSYWFVFRPQNDEIEAARKEISHKEATLNQLAIATAQIDNLQRENEELQAAIANAESRLPNTKEVEVILEQVADLVARRELHARELGAASRFRLTAVKIMADGVPENGTASMLTPYLGAFGEGEHPLGIPFVGGQALIDAIVALDAAGFSAHVHAIGDRAVRDTLDGFEAAREANGWNTPGRHHVAHVQFVHPDDVARFAALGVTANIQALWACYEPQLRDLTAPIVGPERVGHQYPFASIHRPPLASQITDFSTSEGEHRREEGGKGANLRDLSHAAGDARPRLCAGSDWPVSTPDPWAAIHVAVNRQLPADDPDFDPEPLLLHEALTLAEALDAYTAGSAFINGRGPGDAEVTGIIEVGAVADLAATDRDPFAGPVASIHSTRNVGTWVAGRRVHG